MPYCIYSLLHSDEFLRKRLESGKDAFEYDINDEAIWKYPDGKCGNPSCGFIHNRKEHIEHIMNDASEYIFSIIKLPYISMSIYIPVEKKKFDERYSKVCFASKDYCKCALHKSNRYAASAFTENYVRHNTWYAIYHISSYVRHVENINKRHTHSLIKIFWAYFSAIHQADIPRRLYNCNMWHLLRPKKFTLDIAELLQDHIPLQVLAWASSIEYEINRNVYIYPEKIPVIAKDEETLEKLKKFVESYGIKYLKAITHHEIYEELIRSILSFL